MQNVLKVELQRLRSLIKKIRSALRILAESEEETLKRRREHLHLSSRCKNYQFSMAGFKANASY